MEKPGGGVLPGSQAAGDRARGGGLDHRIPCGSHFGRTPPATVMPVFQSHKSAVGLSSGKASKRILGNGTF
ncbi:hypothetical protein GN956_G8435 [Arapaima gigas]